MTDFSKVKNYYQHFDESNRLSCDNSGKLEFEMTMRILKKYLPAHAKILDLGGASGTYSFPLADLGYDVFLADLSDKLIDEARGKNRNAANKLKSCDVVNAVDLNIYEDETFDVVLVFGPLYHLTENKEREACIKEVHRVLKRNGLIFASFIPHLAGSIAVADRYFMHPEQVDESSLSEVFKSGRFYNLSETGFQEGFYPTSGEVAELFRNQNFEKIEIRSIRGWGYEKEDNIYAVKNAQMFHRIMELIEETADKKEIVEMCGHAMYVGRKVERSTI